jgi:hypothetical protein
MPTTVKVARLIYRICLEGNIPNINTKGPLTLKNTILWDITPCSPLKVKQSFGGTYRLHLKFSYWFLVRLILRLWRWRGHVPPKRRLTFNGLHGRTLHNHCSENLESYRSLFNFVRGKEMEVVCWPLFRAWNQQLPTCKTEMNHSEKAEVLRKVFNRTECVATIHDFLMDTSTVADC